MNGLGESHDPGIARDVPAPSPCRRTALAREEPARAYQELSRPSTIFGTACSGLPSLRVSASKPSRALLDQSGVDLVAGEGVRLGERAVQRDLVRGGVVGTLDLDDHTVGPSAVLDVHVGVDTAAGGGLEAHHVPEFDVLPLGEIQRLDLLASSPLRPTRRRTSTASASRCTSDDEVLGLGREVGLGLELDQRDHVAVTGNRDRSLGVLSILQRRDLGQALLPQDLGRPVTIAVGLGRAPSWRPSSPHRWRREGT